MKIRTRLEYRCEKYRDFDYIDRAWHTRYDRSFDMVASAITEEACKDIMASFECAIINADIQTTFESNLEPKFDKKKKMWIGVVEVYVDNEYVTDEKEVIKKVYNEWKKSEILGVKEMAKKYELSNEILITDSGMVLYRVKALKDFGDIKKGDLGGYVESEKNLSHEGNCWIYNDAWVVDNALVSENAKIYDEVLMLENAIAYGNAIIKEDYIIYGNTRVNNKY